jgi:uncharacterized membrane protein
VTGSTPTPPVPETKGSSYSRDRVLTLSDGVFAIALTLLAFNIVPHIAATVTGSQFARALWDLAPVLVTYFLSFLVIGRFWDSHRTFFRFIYLADSRVSWINLLILLWITLIPATAALVGSHWQEPAALTLYALDLVLTMVSYWLLWRYVTSARYVREEAVPAMAPHYLARYIGFSVVGYTLAIPAAFLSPPVALGFIFLTSALARLLARRVLVPASALVHPSQATNQMDDEE